MILFYILLGYLLFQFITGFIIPVFRTTKHVREQFSQMNQNQGRPQSPDSSTAAGKAGSGNSANGAPHKHPDASKVGEYIDFEEVRP